MSEPNGYDPERGWPAQSTSQFTDYLARSASTKLVADLLAQEQDARRQVAKYRSEASRTRSVSAREVFYSQVAFHRGQAAAYESAARRAAAHLGVS
jgi:hypothetical protein